MKKQIRVRFAPSPTGYLHIGSARTALLNWLFARKHNGRFILRIEDTDIKRSGSQYTDAIMDSLHWLGLDWDEGPNIGGEFGPYKQSLRTNSYKDYFSRLNKNGMVYPCYCTPEELEEQRRKALALGKPPRYDNRCRNLSDTERRKFEDEGRRPVWRFKVTEGRKIVVHDLARGDILFDTDLIGDFVILRQDGSPTFNFVVSVDDICMKITHIIRGEDHLSNTPRHILLWQALGADIPDFIHTPLILGSDKTGLSKRYNAISIAEFRKSGYLPEGMINYIGLLGWSPGNKKELFSKEALIKAFSIEGLSSSPSGFDRDKLDWVNSHYIQTIDLNRLTNLIIPYLKDAGLIKAGVSEKKFAVLKQMIAAIRGNLKRLDASVQYMKIFLEDTLTINDIDGALKEDYVKGLFKKAADAVLTIDKLDKESVKKIFLDVQSELHITGRRFYLPLRLALTGMAEGPELIDIIPLIGRDKILMRLENVSG